MTLSMILIMMQVMYVITFMGYSGVAHDAWHETAQMPYPATMDGEETDVVTKFEALAASAKAHKDALDDELAAMYKLLPAMRRAGKGPTAIERMSFGLIPRDTASRVTAKVIGTSRKEAPTGS